MTVPQRAIHSIPTGEHFDAIVIGGGINGIATYRDLSLQGLNVLLIEKDDFCSKASAAPSRMIHGGLRYLENAEFDLVKESLNERNRLLKNAPHLVHPLQTHIPLTSWLKGIVPASLRFFGLEPKTSERGAFIVKLGLGLYDFFTRHDQVMPNHQMYGQKQTNKRWPHFDQKVCCSAAYYDAWISSPERLAIELLKEGDASQRQPHALNYTFASVQDNGSIELTDQLTSHQVHVTTTQLINATGAWIDNVNHQAGNSTQYLSNTKGSHIIVDHPELLSALQGDMVYYENKENRVCIMFPYLGKVLIGSTDIPVTQPDNVRCTDEEVNYIIESVRAIFPTVIIHPSDILYQFSGIRPLGAATKASAGQIPRSHITQRDHLFNGEITCYSMIGGKWTTFRAFAEEVTDQVLKDLGAKRLVSTQDRIIGGGQGFPKSSEARDKYIQHLTALYQQSDSYTALLVSRYGTECEAILEHLQSSGFKPLRTLPHYTEGELEYLMTHEYVQTPLDLIQRRTSVAIEGSAHDDALQEIIELMSRFFNWDESTRLRLHSDSVNSLNFYNGLQLMPVGEPTEMMPKTARKAHYVYE